VIFQVKLLATTARTIRMGILQLQGSGTIDTVPASLVTTWNGNTTDPTWAANIAVITGAQSKSVTTTWTNFTVSVTLPADAKNLIVAVWADSQFAINDLLLIAEAGLFDGSAARNWLPRLIGTEFELCQRYYYSTYDLDTAPGTITNNGRLVYTAQRTAGAETFTSFAYPPMRKSPTGTAYSPITGASGKIADTNLGVDLIATVSAGQKSSFINAGSSHNALDGITAQVTLDAEL
jgi:hypothetical protein